MIQNPKLAFRDLRLQTCRIERTNLNQPRVWSGQFAIVFKGVDAQGRAWAIRAFTRESRDRREHYEYIGTYLKSHRLDCLVDFEYRDGAIRSAGDGKWYPLVVMDWVEGLTLFDWVQSKCRVGKGASIGKSVQHWLRLTKELEQAQIAHCDLQHANVLVTPRGYLKLVDYDGMFVPPLAGRRNLEIGLKPYQHPQRTEETLLAANLDHFSALVIYVALRALAADPGLWHKHVEQPGYDKLLFRSEDFAQGHASTLYQDLMQSPDLGVRDLTARLFAYTAGELSDVAALDQVLAACSASGRSDATPSVEPFRPPKTAPVASSQLAAAHRPSPPTTRWVLEITTPAGSDTLTVDRTATVLVGRGEDCTVRIAGDRRVSRRQFLIEFAPPSAPCLRDLGSRNGTVVNGIRYGGQNEQERPAHTDSADGSAVELKHEDLISIGRTVIQIRVEKW